MRVFRNGVTHIHNLWLLMTGSFMTTLSSKKRTCHLADTKPWWYESIIVEDLNLLLKTVTPTLYIHEIKSWECFQILYNFFVLYAQTPSEMFPFEVISIERVFNISLQNINYSCIITKPHSIAHKNVHWWKSKRWNQV